MNKQSKAAQKANRTRKARRSFVEHYPETARIARDILRGCNTEDIAWEHDVSIATVAAVKANLNRNNAFSVLAHSCNF